MMLLLMMTPLRWVEEVNGREKFGRGLGVWLGGTYRVANQRKFSQGDLEITRSFCIDVWLAKAKIFRPDMVWR